MSRQNPKKRVQNVPLLNLSRGSRLGAYTSIESGFLELIGRKLGIEADLAEKVFAQQLAIARRRFHFSFNHDADRQIVFPIDIEGEFLGAVGFGLFVGAFDFVTNAPSRFDDLGLSLETYTKRSLLLSGLHGGNSSEEGILEAELIEGVAARLFGLVGVHFSADH